jgi:small subunit ribosomal protein S4
MKTGPRFKIAKRLGASVFEKTQSQKFALSAERSAKNKKGGGGRGGRSEYGKQMLEKQKVRITYGVTERQFRNYVRQALMPAEGTPLERLHTALETRLDNVVYRIGLASSRRAARQMVAHGHVLVQGKKVRVPSYVVKQNDVLAVREGSKTHGSLINFPERFVERTLPSWLIWDASKMEGGIKAQPSEASAEPAGDLRAVLSFYTR